jgi:hypothetical protein
MYEQIGLIKVTTLLGLNFYQENGYIEVWRIANIAHIEREAWKLRVYCGRNPRYFKEKLQVYGV